MRKYFIWALAALITPSMASMTFAQEETKSTKQESTEVAEEEIQEMTPREQLDELMGEFSKFQSGMNKKAREIRKEMAGEDREAMMEAMEELQTEMTTQTAAMAEKMVFVAERAEEDREASMEAITWLLTSGNDSELTAKAGDLVIKYHLENENLNDVLSQITMPSQAAHDLFEQVIEKSDNKTVRALTSLLLVDFISSAKEMGPMIESNAQLAETYPEVVTYIKTLEEIDDDAMTARYEKIVAEFGDVAFEESTIGEMVAKKLRIKEIRDSIAIGKVAHDIEGPDIDGENFKLSDYRGKVVMLDFWGDW